MNELFKGIVTSELIRPSGEFWIVAPWISNVQVLDDSTGRFRIINPSGNHAVDLVDFLGHLQDTGTRVTVVTQTEVNAETNRFLRILQSVTHDLSWPTNLRVLQSKTIHAKGILGDRYCLSGSMNLTWSGLNKNDELVHFHTDIQTVSELRDAFENEYGAWSRSP